MPLDHFDACAAVVQYATNLWNSRPGAARQKVPTLDLIRALYVDGIPIGYMGAPFDIAITDQAIRQRITTALEAADKAFGDLCWCDNLSLCEIAYNIGIGWTKRIEDVRRFDRNASPNEIGYGLPERPNRTKPAPKDVWDYLNANRHKPEHKAEKRRLADDLVADYLANGGEITKCRPQRRNPYSEQRWYTPRNQFAHLRDVENHLGAARFSAFQDPIANAERRRVSHLIKAHDATVHETDLSLPLAA